MLKSPNRRPLLIGVVHLRPLPGSPRWQGDLQKVLKLAVADARAYEDGGADAVFIENFGDVPFTKGKVGPETIAAMAATVNEDASARKKFIAPVTVPTWARATAFWIDTTVIGKVVPRPNEKIDSSTSMPQSGRCVSASAAPETVAMRSPTIATRL